MFGHIHVVFVGDFHQLQPVQGKALFKEETLQFQAINKAIFLNISHRFIDDPPYGEAMRKFRNGSVTKNDIAYINQRYIDNEDVNLPEMSKLRYACSTNIERNAIDATFFLKHLENTHYRSDNLDTPCPNHTVIIKGTFRYKGKNGKPISTYLQNRIYDECGDAKLNKSDKTKVDPALKFYYKVPLMMNSNKRISESLANGTSCYGMYIQLNDGCEYEKENWEGFIVNTIQASKVKYIICKREKTSPGQLEYFKVKPESSQVTTSLKDVINIKINDLCIKQLSVNSNIATTGHKLQGKTLSNLVINSWNYCVQNWVYVVLSRVKTLSGIVLNQKLDENKTFMCDPVLLR